MVAQIRPLDQQPPRLERKHQVPPHPHPLQAPDGAAIPRVSERAEMVEQHPDADPTRVRRLERIEERGRGLIEGQDITSGGAPTALLG